MFDKKNNDVKILKKKFTFKSDFGDEQKIGKPYKLAYSKCEKIIFKNGVSQKFPIFEDGSSHVFGLLRDDEYGQPFINININAITPEFRLNIDSGLRTIDEKRPHLIESEKDVNWKNFTLSMDVYKDAMKNTKIPDFLKERKELGKWNITKNYLRVVKMLDEYITSINISQSATYLFNDWADSIVNYPEYRDLLNSILMEEVITINPRDIPNNYSDYLKFLLAKSPIDFTDDYTIHFELKSELVKIRENGELYVVNKAGEEQEHLTTFYNELINHLEVTWLRTNVHVVNKVNDKYRNAWFTSHALRNRYIFNEKMDEFVKLISKSDNLDEKFDKRFVCKSVAKLFNKYFKINSTLAYIQVFMDTPQNLDLAMNIFKSIFKIGEIKRNCPLFKRLADMIEAEHFGDKTIKDGVIKFLNDDVNRWIFVQAFDESVDYIREQGKTDNGWENIFIFLTNHIDYAKLTEIFSQYKDFISDIFVNLLKHLIEKYVDLFKDANSRQETVKNLWKEFQIKFEPTLISLFGFKVMGKILSICGNIYEKYIDTTIDKYPEVNPFGDKEISKEAKEFEELVKNLIYITVKKLDDTVNEYKNSDTNNQEEANSEQ